MPLSDYLNSVMAGPSSRKRSYTEIARSESPADDMPPRSKRRRISDSPSTTSESAPPRGHPSSRTGRLRYEGDGLDYRRPVISSTHQTSRVAPTIDLTADDDDIPMTLPQLHSRRRSPSVDGDVLRDGIPQPITRTSTSTGVRDNPTVTQTTTSTIIRRAPPFGRNHHSPGPEVIDLLTDSDGMESGGNEDGRNSFPQSNRSRVAIEDSPEIEVLWARPVSPSPNTAAGAARAARRLPTPPAMRVESGLQGLTSFLQRSRELIFGNHTGRGAQGAGNPYNDDLLDRIDGLNGRIRPPGPVDNVAALDPVFGMPEYVDVALDYQQPGFDIGIMGSEADRSSTPPEIIEQEPYKEPAPAGDGFSRNLKEDDIVVCPSCGDELALGEGEVKQQIWIAKQCGHVYCGTCATNRHMTKNPSKKQIKAAKQRKMVHDLKTCIVEGCKTRLGTNAAMVQIYL